MSETHCSGRPGDAGTTVAGSRQQRPAALNPILTMLKFRQILWRNAPEITAADQCRSIAKNHSVVERERPAIANIAVIDINDV